MLQHNDLIKALIKEVMGEFTQADPYEEIAGKAYEMGRLYAETKKFDNSKYYHNYQFCLDDGEKISSSSFFNQFMSRNQTRAYMEGEKTAKVFFDDDKDILFHLVRDKRMGINGVFKAVMSPGEPQQLNVSDFVLVISAFACGVMSFYQE